MKILKSSKKILHVLLILSLTLMITACATQDITSTTEPSQSRVTEPTTSESSNIIKIDNSSAKIAVMTQAYNGDNIVEILTIDYNNEKNSEIDAFNNAIKFGVQEIYNTFNDNPDGRSWIEMRSYPFTSNEYLQIVTTSCIYPNYATDGFIYSYNFDLKNNKFMSVDDALSDLNLNRDSVAEAVLGLLENEYENDTRPNTVDVKGFLITQGQSGPLTQLLLEVDFVTGEGDIWHTILGYTPELGEINHFNMECLFDPSDVDQMDPPLSYQITKLSDSLSSTLFFDPSGLEYLPEREAYLYDGMLHFSVEALPHVPYSKDDVLNQIKSLEASTIELINITESDEHTQLLQSPCWLVVYQVGESGDAFFCEDIYVQTDIADFRLHTRVAAEFSLDYHDEIGRRLATVYWAE